MRLEFLAEAVAELEEPRDFYQAKEPALGARFVAMAQLAIARALAMPASGALVAGVARAKAIDRFPVRVVYVVRGERLVVVAIAHAARRPGYWVARLR